MNLREARWNAQKGACPLMFWSDKPHGSQRTIRTVRNEHFFKTLKRFGIKNGLDWLAEHER
jgi:hypothetical protein